MSINKKSSAHKQHRARNISKGSISKKALEKAYITPFAFESSFLNEWCKFVREYNPSNYRQIEIQAVQCMSAIISYCNQPNLPFFLLDISDSGTGKSRNKKFQFDILFDPIKQELDKKFKASNEIELYSFLIEGKITSEGIFTSALNQRVFFANFGEIGTALKNKDPKTQEILTMLTDKNSANNTLTRPVYKNSKGNSKKKALPPFLDNVKFYLSADTNLQQLGCDDSVIKEYLGGLFNRFVIVYTKDILSYENFKFNANKPLNDEISKFQNFIIGFMNFLKLEKYEININAFHNNANYDKFCKETHKKKQDKSNEYKELYSRTTQNLNAIIQTLHYLKQYESIKAQRSVEFSPLVDDSTIEEAISFIEPYIDLSLMFDELNGQSDSIQSVRNKMIEYIEQRIKKYGNCTMKNIADNRPFKDYKTNDIRQILNDFIIENRDKTISLLKND
ncbi:MULTISPECIES: hypothetical protein [unclassified Campylobacter]|uniref:hypothetical protein n=1 Tax=unclassified Campylobacter TaxID=2593542 RepID=UPI0022EA07FC|nr:MULTISPECIES: hypothetical protein [unclassified Campylobacter]MDA3054952.1 hypothetical protein [Campylobacter sp. VBCF_07 NA4]MDA3060454.1 hypothetical protein [Campylobacter sp. VBCF_02 NA5]MDA3070280.1 hypothetical protein [Campylobacter sp. VBCF_08 NA3]WBR54711.1 hypothetical protein PF027_02235 [Campylobacter sp. VBCF_01 NA2]